MNQEEGTHLTLWVSLSWTSSLQSCRKYISVAYKPLSLWQLKWTKTPSASCLGKQIKQAHELSFPSERKFKPLKPWLPSQNFSQVYSLAKLALWLNSNQLETARVGPALPRFPW